jgi:hypothetical protein
MSICRFSIHQAMLERMRRETSVVITELIGRIRSGIWHRDSHHFLLWDYGRNGAYFESLLGFIRETKIRAARRLHLLKEKALAQRMASQVLRRSSAAAALSRHG